MLSLKKRHRTCSNTIKETKRKVRDQDTISSSKFRFLNEQMYTKASNEFQAEYLKNKEAKGLFCKLYHSGYKAQVAKWPLHPLEKVKSLLSNDLKKNREPVIIDMGCGEGKLTKMLEDDKRFKVIGVDFAPSPDLVNPTSYSCADDYLKHGGFIESNMDKITILPDKCADAIVYSLSLMGINWPHFIYEGSRILRDGGVMYIAEVSSRIKSVSSFVKSIGATGFSLRKNITVDNGYFQIMSFTKKSSKTSMKQIEQNLLSPCIYKKR